MGSGSSIITQNSSAEQLSDAIASFGEAYKPYATAVKENAIDSSILLEMDMDEIVEELHFADMSKIHRLKLKSVYDKLKSSRKDESTEQKSILGNQHIALIERANQIRMKILTLPSELQHLFISYRQASDSPLAESIYTGTRAAVLDREFGKPGLKPQIFFDKKSLKDGELWESGFVVGLLSSLIVLPVVSWIGENQGSVGLMMNLSDDSPSSDNVLLEWELSLVLKEWSDCSFLQSILPIIHGGQDKRGFLDFPFEKLKNLDGKSSIATKKKLIEICEANGIPISEQAIRRTPLEVVQLILKNQGIQLSAHGNPTNAIDYCVHKVFDMGAEVIINKLPSIERKLKPISEYSAEELMTFLKENMNSGTHITNACKAISNMAVNADNKVMFCSMDVVPLLKTAASKSISKAKDSLIRLS
jgi:hypothetical protein